MENAGLKILAAVGVVSLVIQGGRSAATAILDNIKATTGTASLDVSTSPIGANGEIYARIDIPLTVENGNPFPLMADHLSGVVKYGSLTLTEIRATKNLYVPANSSATIILDIDVPTRRVFQDIQQAMQGGNWYGTLVNRILFSGTVRLSGLGRSISFPLTDIPIPIA